MDFLLSFAGGVMASITPCCLAGISLVIGYIGARETTGYREAFFLSLLLIAGMSFTFSVLGVVAVLMGEVFGSIIGVFWRYLLAVLIILMGLYLLGWLPFRLPVISFKAPLRKGAFGAFLVGMVYGVVASPCSTPILVSILSYASLQGNLVKGIIMLLLYGLGHGLIFLLLGTWAGAARSLAALRTHGNLIQKVSAFLVIAAGFYLFMTV